MAYSGVNVSYFPGDGLRFPINQDPNPIGAWSGPGALLPKHLASKYFRRQHGIPNRFATKIVSLPQYSQVVPSYTSQYGRGRKTMKNKLHLNMMLGQHSKTPRFF